VRSLADAVAKVLREHENTKVAAAVVQAGQVELNLAATTDTAVASVATAKVALGAKVQTDLCPECGNASLRFIEGCQKCEICGFSKC